MVQAAVRCLLLSLLLLLLGAKPSEPLDIRADRLELDQRTGAVRFEGAVEATQGELVLRCAVLSATYADGEITALEASGGVVVTQGDVRAEAQTARYHRSEDRLELTGQPRVVRGKDSMTGARITFWPGQGRLVVEQARGRIDAPKLELPSVGRPGVGQPGVGQPGVPGAGRRVAPPDAAPPGPP